MHRRFSVLALAVSSMFAACVAPSGPGSNGSGPSSASPNEWDGTLVPASGTVIEVWPETFAGELVVLDVLPHGSLVKQGDVIAHLDLRAIDEQIRQAELEAHSALVRQSNAEGKDRIERAAADSALEEARASLDRARRALDGWEKHELEFAKRNAEIDDRRRVAGIEDETDELTQLEKMYKADELIDATQEIVLKRSRRALDLSKVGLALNREERSFQEKIEETLQTEAKREGVHVQEGALERLTQSQAIDRRAAEDVLERSKAQLADQQKKLDELHRDRDLMTVHAPRAGILLHGAIDDYRPKETPPRHDRGTRLATRTPLFTVGDPEKLVVAVDVPESKLEVAKPGTTVEIHPVFDPKASVAGKLRIDQYPQAKSAATPENNYEANVDMEHELSGARVGMRVKVKVASDGGVGATKAASIPTHAADHARSAATSAGSAAGASSS